MSLWKDNFSSNALQKKYLYGMRSTLASFHGPSQSLPFSRWCVCILGPIDRILVPMQEKEFGHSHMKWVNVYGCWEAPHRNRFDRIRVISNRFSNDLDILCPLKDNSLSCPLANHKHRPDPMNWMRKARLERICRPSAEWLRFGRVCQRQVRSLQWYEAHPMKWRFC